MLCGGPSVLADLKALLLARGYEEGSVANARRLRARARVRRDLRRGRPVGLRRGAGCLGAVA